jgi:hypothetical protein
VLSEPCCVISAMLCYQSHVVLSEPCCDVRAMLCYQCHVVLSEPCCVIRARLCYQCHVVLSVPCCVIRAMLCYQCHVVLSEPCCVIRAMLCYLLENVLMNLKLRRNALTHSRCNPCTGLLQAKMITRLWGSQISTRRWKRCHAAFTSREISPVLISVTG